MGNRICRAKGRSGRGRAIEERFTKPHRLVRQPSNVDYKKLRKLILSEKLAPCFDGADDFNPDLEECPICFFEEQKVIEAKIRMQSEDVDCFTLADCISSDVEAQAMGANFGPLSSHRGNPQDDRDLHVAALEEMTVVAQSMDLNYSNGRHEDLDLDLEEIMMTEAIWRSIQDLGQPCGSSSTVECRSSGHESNQCGPSSASVDERDIPSADSINAGLAVAVARMAEHNIQWPEMLQSVHENNHSNQSVDGVGPTGASACCEINEEHSEGGCLESCSSTSEDDSCELLAARVLEENPGLGSVFDADKDLVSEVVNDECCSSSSIHTLSDGSGDSSHCFNDGADTSHSHLSTPTVVRPVMMAPNATA
ncbi:hypothetical protein ACLOJK_030551 [Asimina triloba]